MVQPLHAVPRPVRTPERRKRPPRTTPKNKKWLRDDRSRGSGDSGATPSSVHLVGGLPLTRDLSDLSGSYAAGRGAAASHRDPSNYSGASVPRDVYPSGPSGSPYDRPWSLARILSTREPHAPQPPCMDCDDSVGFLGTARKPTVVVEQSDVVEVVKPEEEGSPHRRTPLVILLMDPERKVYELMQVWIDNEVDIVRDVLHTIQNSLRDKENWMQDYDGLFQVRNNHFSQLIHILSLSKYHVEPHELWVAKPWSMSAKSTVGYAGALLNYLKGVEVLQYTSVADHNRFKIAKPAGKPDDSILVLTKEAKSRVYVPGGILKHRHAYQFLSFSPPFEPMVHVDVLGADVYPEGDDALSQLSGSHAGMSLASDKFSMSRASFTDLVNSRKPSFSKPLPRADIRRMDTISTSRLSQNDLLIKPERPRSFARAFSILNCSSCKNDREDVHEKGSRYRAQADFGFGASGTVLGSTVAGSPVWQVWEEGSRTGYDSVTSDSQRPLLIARPPRSSEWMAEF